MNTIGIGLIGLGRHGMRYAQHLLTQLPQARLVAVCRRDVGQGLTFAQQHNLRFYADYRELIADSQVEAVLVVTSPSLTLPIALEAIRKGKPLLIEKPLAVTAAEASQIVQSATKANVPLMTAHTLRYDGTISKLKDIAFEIGAWKYMVLTARMEQRAHSAEEIRGWKGQGALLEIGIHLLDLVRFLTGDEVEEVHCELGHPSPDEPEERAWGRLLTQSGLPCLLDVSRVSESRITRAEIIGENGQIMADWTTSTVELVTQKIHREKHVIPPTPTVLRVLQEFVDALQTGRKLAITGLDGLRAVEIAEACYESANIGKAIQLNRNIKS